MTYRFKADGVTGTVAVYDYTTADDDPFDDPTGNVGRLLFHSDLDAISVVDSVSDSITLPSRSANANDADTHVLFAHGRSGIPYVEGRIWYDSDTSTVYPLAGAVPIEVAATGLLRVITLGADATNVVLHEQWATYFSSGFSAIDLSYEIYVTDLDCTGTYPPTYAEDDLLLSPSRCVMGKGKFDTDRRYFRAAASGALFPMVKSRTWVANGMPGNSHHMLYRWSVGTMSETYDAGYSVTGDPDYTLVKI